LFYAYVLWSETANRFYIGSSADPSSRLAQHNQGKTRSTKPYVPWKLVWQESFESRALAVQRERYLKGLKSKRVLRELMREGRAFA
jgi:putative endonuclease